jgi:hypothetical protein
MTGLERQSARIGLSGQDCRDRIARIEKQNWQTMMERTARIWKSGYGSQNRTGYSENESKNRTS